MGAFGEEDTLSKVVFGDLRICGLDEEGFGNVGFEGAILDVVGEGCGPGYDFEMVLEVVLEIVLGLMAGPLVVVSGSFEDGPVMVEFEVLNVG